MKVYHVDNLQGDNMGLRRLMQGIFEQYNTGYLDLPRSVRKAVSFILQEHLSYLGLLPLSEMARSIMEIEKQNISGIFVEAGCALGGSAIAIASAKKVNRPLQLFDTFELIPPPSDNDGKDVHDRYAVIKSGQSKGLGGRKYYGYVKELQEVVKDNFSAAGYPVDCNAVTLIKGEYSDSLRIQQPVAFAHIDCDWYESVKICLERIAPHLSQGGLLIIDDYYEGYSGCRKAVDDFLERNSSMFSIVSKSRLYLRRN